MSKLAEALRKHKIYNNWGILKRLGQPRDVVISYSNPTPRTCRPRQTRVWSLSRCPELEGFSKSFLGPKKQTFQKAKDWAEITFGHHYVLSPFGGYIPEHLLEKAKELAQQPIEVQGIVYYDNTPEEAAKRGWLQCPEYLSGDPTLPLVRHNYQTGSFTYVAKRDDQ